MSIRQFTSYPKIFFGNHKSSWCTTFSVKPLLIEFHPSLPVLTTVCGRHFEKTPYHYTRDIASALLAARAIVMAVSKNGPTIACFTLWEVAPRCSPADSTVALQSFYIENKNVGNKAESEDWRSEPSDQSIHQSNRQR